MKVPKTAHPCSLLRRSLRCCNIKICEELLQPRRNTSWRGKRSSSPHRGNRPNLLPGCPELAADCCAGHLEGYRVAAVASSRQTFQALLAAVGSGGGFRMDRPKVAGAVVRYVRSNLVQHALARYPGACSTTRCQGTKEKK